MVNGVALTAIRAVCEPPVFCAPAPHPHDGAQTYSQFPLPVDCENIRLGGSFTSQQTDWRDQEIVNKSRIEAASLPQKSPFLPTVSFEEPEIKRAYEKVLKTQNSSIP